MILHIECCDLCSKIFPSAPPQAITIRIAKIDSEMMTMLVCSSCYVENFVPIENKAFTNSKAMYEKVTKL